MVVFTVPSLHAFTTGWQVLHQLLVVQGAEPPERRHDANRGAEPPEHRRGHRVKKGARVLRDTTHTPTRLVAAKYSIENDTKVQMIHFDLWSVERHPQGSII